MKKTFLASLILAGSLGAASAQAHEALVGGGVGSLIGHSVGGRDGAVVGGIVGALAGVVLASDNNPRYVSTGHARPVHYTPPAPRHAPVYHGHPNHVRPVMVQHRQTHYNHRHDSHRHWR